MQKYKRIGIISSLLLIIGCMAQRASKYNLQVSVVICTIEF
jgi:hypothetical protein